MEGFDQHEGLVIPFDRSNVDTDQIIPKQFLKSIKRTGFGNYLFDAWRFLDEGDLSKTPNDRQINHEFVLNDPRYQDASILVARKNFGCGSRREHAVWALMEYGIKCVIAPSFADIFYNNCFKNGLLPIVLKEENVDRVFEIITKKKAVRMDVNLEKQTISLDGGTKYSFEIDENRKVPLLRGLDEIGMTLDHVETIRAFEEKHKRSMPWIFRNEEK